MSKTATDPNKVRLANVRLSFPQLFKPKAFSDDQEAKYGANFLMHKQKNAADIKALKTAIKECAERQWPKGLPKGLKGPLHEASEKDYDGYDEDHLYLSSSSSRRPPVVDRDKSPLTSEDGKPYAGCFVNASVRVWAQDNKWGKRVNCEVLAVQFFKDGESFGAAPVDADDEFDDVSDGDDASDLL